MRALYLALCLVAVVAKSAGAATVTFSLGAFVEKPPGAAPPPSPPPFSSAPPEERPISPPKAREGAPPLNQVARITIADPAGAGDDLLVERGALRPDAFPGEITLHD